MRLLRDAFLIVFFCTPCVGLTGCSSNEPTVAPRTEEEIEAYKEEVYAAEEADTEEE